ncbi:GtrA family protein [Lutimaribacter sp. EGI FJ00015]|uniref:GtrA family protein n=1 Tax=Lutimaribacter degradans TaxID=2945989 RepID=A0ACC5ZVV3_9RHOB|nr:GtrA family protein [Lutimaribacter sp. EGI FJ00013]MCO0613473.1 GtrA family protein [Lutimaribacter sp. EGI FJ00015]MCO0636447.1 GtrA family protein [Lutimaribacter sp. EGI FJ00014]
MTRTTLVIRYTAFAVAATLANLGAQRLVLALDEGPRGFAAAVLAGTLVGLVLKYLLDKRWIFEDHTTGVAAHGRKFTLYTAMGIATTAIFWATETAFWIIWHTDLARETGAVLGLAVGYVIKYRLDRRFVFTNTVAGAA